MAETAGPRPTQPWFARMRPLIGVAVLVGGWWLLHASRAVEPVLLPSPMETFAAFWKGITQGTLGTLGADFWKTIVRTLWSFGIALVIAVPLGIVLGSSRALYESIEFAIDFFHSTPAFAMFPLFLVILGVGEKTKVAVAAFGAALVILFNVAYGVMGARKQRQLAARVMGASRVRVLTDVTLLESMPQVFVGMRSGVSLALVFVAEMFIGSTDGLSQRVMNAQMIFDMPEMYAAIFAAGLLGYVMNLVFILAERRFVHWGGK
jgi:sulfonate transport system permease protein